MNFEELFRLLDHSVLFPSCYSPNQLAFLEIRVRRFHNLRYSESEQHLHQLSSSIANSNTLNLNTDWIRSNYSAKSDRIRISMYESPETRSYSSMLNFRFSILEHGRKIASDYRPRSERNSSQSLPQVWIARKVKVESKIHNLIKNWKLLNRSREFENNHKSDRKSRRFRAEWGFESQER